MKKCLKILKLDSCRITESLKYKHAAYRRCKNSEKYKFKKKMPKFLLTTIALCVHLILYLQCAYI